MFNGKCISNLLLACQPDPRSSALLAKHPLPAANSSQQVFSKEGLNRIDAFFAGEIANDRMPGAVIGVAKNGKMVLYKAYGYLDKENKTLMPVDAIFSIASMTKVMATVGALTFYEEGKMLLNAPIANWFPQFKNMKVGCVGEDGELTLASAKRLITVQDLMRHTSGLVYGGRGNTPVHKQYPEGSWVASLQYDGEQLIDKLASLPLLFEPGTTWDYGFGIDVLGFIEEKIAGKSLGAILRERVFDKVGMPKTGFCVTDSARLARALPVDPVTGKPQKFDKLTQKPKFDSGGAGAFSTVGGYLRFGQMLLNGGSIDGRRVLGPQTVALMTSDHLGSDIKNNLAAIEPGRAGYGFGLGVAVRKERGVAAINGNIGDYTWNGADGTIFWVDPKEQMVAVMGAVAPGEIRKVHREKLAAVIYGALGE